MRAPRRLTALALGIALVVAAVVLGLFLRSSAVGPRWLPDAFDYKPGVGPPGFIGGPEAFTAAALSGVSASSRDDAWIVGAAPCCSYPGNPTPRSLAWHWNGTAWRGVPTPKLHLAYPYPAAVAAISNRDAWLVGEAATYTVSPSGRQWPGPQEALIEHWDGSRWTVVRPPVLGERSRLDAVSAFGSRDVWAIGETDGAVGIVHHQRFIPRHAVLLHWNGTAWRHVAIPWARPGVTLGNVVAIGSDSVWVTQGYSDAVTGMPVARPLEFWNGASWKAIPAPFGRADPPSGFAATSESDAWAVGSYGRLGGSAFSSSVAAHWNGSKWQIAPVPSMPGAANYIALNDVVAVRPNDVWLSSFNWLSTAKRGLNNVALLEHWDGHSWRITSGTPPPVQSFTPSLRLGVAPDGTAWAIDANECDNVVLRWKGDAWATTPHPHDRYLESYIHRMPPSMRLLTLRELACTPSGEFPRPGPTGKQGPTGSTP